MRRRYIQHMQAIQPSPKFLHTLESGMNRELRRKGHDAFLPRALTAAGVVAAAVLAVAGIGALRSDNPDIISPPPVVAAGTTASVAPESTLLAETDVLYRLEMLDESVKSVLTDVNYYYGCYPLMPQEQLSVHETSAADSAIIETLLPGTVFWTDQFTLSDGELREIRWYDAASASMRTGWAGKTANYDGESSLSALGIPGKVRAAEAVMRYGASINAPEIISIPEGQLLHLCYQTGNWVFASTAPFDQTVENPPLPTAGWVHVKDIVGLRYAEETAAPTTAPTVNPTRAYPPDDVRLELEMSDEAVFAVSGIADDWGGVLMFNSNLAGAYNSSIVEICQSSELNSVVDEPLYPGTAYWPHSDASAGDLVDLTDKKGKVVGYAQCVTYLNPETNTLKEGWIHTLYSADPRPEVPDNPVESIQMPGKIKTGGTPIRYGTSADAPVIAVLEENQKLGLGYRVGNWIYASTEPFCADGEKPVTGWVHITEVIGMEWRITIGHVELTADEVNLRETPDGKIIATLDKYTRISYGGVTVPGKTGDWHFVTVNAFEFAGPDAVPVTGYISADYSKLNTFRLESELSLDGVVSATLAYSDTSPFGPAEQTVAGETLLLLLDRLKNASSESVYTPVCGEGAASITLTYGDDSEVVLPLSGDSCTQVRYGDVTYDLKTDAERTESFLNDGGASLSDILSPVFDQINFP